MNILSRNNFRKLIVLFICLTALSTAFAESKNVDNTTLIDVPKLTPVVLKFVSFDPSRVVLDDSIIFSEFISALNKNTKFPLQKYKSADQSTDYLRGLAYSQGLRLNVDKQKSEIVFQYVNVRSDREVAKEIGQALYIPVSYQIERENDKFLVRLTPPEKASLNDWEYFVTLLFLTREITKDMKIGPIDQYFDDFSKIFSSASAVKLKKFTLVKGEAMSKFKPESSLGNFERLLGRVSSGYSGESKYDLKKDNVFSYLSCQDRIPLKVSVFPYRDGTKVIYEASLPYQIGADGSSDGFDGPQKLKEAVEKILND